MKPQKCDDCGRFGATKLIWDRGPNGRGGRDIETRYLCWPCQAKSPWLVRIEGRRKDEGVQ